MKLQFTADKKDKEIEGRSGRGLDNRDEIEKSLRREKERVTYREDEIWKRKVQ